MKCCESSDENAGKTSCFPDEVTKFWGASAASAFRARDGVYVSGYPSIRVSGYPSARVSEYQSIR